MVVSAGEVARTYRTALRVSEEYVEENWSPESGSFRRSFGRKLERLAARSIRRLCTRNMREAKRRAEEVFPLYLSGKLKTGGNRGRCKIRKHYQERGTSVAENLSGSYLYSVASACMVQMSLVDKLQRVKELLKTDQYADAIPELLLFSHVPRHLATRIAKEYDTTEAWVRRTIRGFRNKIVKHQNPQKPNPARSLSVKPKKFIKEAKAFLERVEETLQRMKEEGRDISRVRAFRNKLVTLKERVTEIKDLLQDIDPTWKSLKALSKAVGKRLGDRRNFQSALRALIARCTVSSKERVKFLRLLTPQICVATPFSNSERKTLPLEMQIGPKYVIPRGNAKQMTKDFNEKGYTEFLIRFRPRRKEVIPMRVIATKRMRQVLGEGARVASIRVLPPKRPSWKIEVDIAFTGPVEAFCLNTRFLEAEKLQDGVEGVDAPKEKSTPTTTAALKHEGLRRLVEALGLDPNRPGKHVFVIGSPEQTPLGDTRLLEKLSQRIICLREEVIPHLSRAKANYIKRRDRRMANKMDEELGLVHARLRRLKRELDRECGRVLARVVWRYRPRLIGFEDCLGPGHSMTTRGTRGALAKAITHMPKRLPQILEYALGVLWERDTQVGLVAVPARVKTHRSCGGQLKPVPGSWDVFVCGRCQERMNRHHYTAREYSIRALSACQGLPATS